jgi:hypothetical protein
MTRDSARVGHLEAGGDCDLGTDLDLEDFTQSVAVRSQRSHIASEARKGETQAVERLYWAAISPGGHEVRTYVQNLQVDVVSVKIPCLKKFMIYR